MKRLVIATNNLSKTKEIRHILSDLHFELATLKDYSPMPEPEENGKTFAENAAIKALAVAQHTGEIAIADDSGLVIDALDGAPGVYSNRFVGPHASDEERIRKVLLLLNDVPDELRTARFTAAIAIAEPGRVIGTAEGNCEGRILRTPRGNNGFGYDPIFQPEGCSGSMAELADDEKNRISHRGRGLEAAKGLLGDFQ